MSRERRSYQVQTGADQFSVEIQEDGAAWRALLNEHEQELCMRSVEGRHHFALLSHGELLEVYVEEIGNRYLVYLTGNVFEVVVAPQLAARKQVRVTPQLPSGVAIVTAPIPGLVLQVSVEPGHQVDRGDILLVLEAMKMENDIRAPLTGIVQRVDVRPGQRVDQGQRLVVIS